MDHKKEHNLEVLALGLGTGTGVLGPTEAE